MPAVTLDRTSPGTERSAIPKPCPVALDPVNGTVPLEYQRQRGSTRAPGEVPGQFLAGGAGAKKSVSSWLTLSASS